MEKYEAEMKKAQDLIAEVKKGELEETELRSKANQAIHALMSAQIEHSDMLFESWQRAREAVQERAAKCTDGNAGEWADIEQQIFEGIKSTTTKEMSPEEIAKMFNKELDNLAEQNDLKTYHSQYADRCESSLAMIVSDVMYMKEAEKLFTDMKERLKKFGEERPYLAEWCEQLSNSSQTTIKDTMSAIEALKK